MMSNETFCREILGNHVEMCRVPAGFIDAVDIVCRCGAFWFIIDAETMSNWQQITEREAMEIVCKFTVNR